MKLSNEEKKVKLKVGGTLICAHVLQHNENCYTRIVNNWVLTAFLVGFPRQRSISAQKYFSFTNSTFWQEIPIKALPAASLEVSHGRNVGFD